MICHVCKKSFKMARWNDVIKSKRTGKQMRVSFYVPYDENTDTFNIDVLCERYPEGEYWIYSFDPSKFEGPIIDVGAYCAKCNADL